MDVYCTTTWSLTSLFFTMSVTDSERSNSYFSLLSWLHSATCVDMWLPGESLLSYNEGGIQLKCCVYFLARAGVNWFVLPPWLLLPRHLLPDNFVVGELFSKKVITSVLLGHL